MQIVADKILYEAKPRQLNGKSEAYLQVGGGRGPIGPIGPGDELELHDDDDKKKASNFFFQYYNATLPPLIKPRTGFMKSMHSLPPLR